MPLFLFPFNLASYFLFYQIDPQKQPFSIYPFIWTLRKLPTTLSQWKGKISKHATTMYVYILSQSVYLYESYLDLLLLNWRFSGLVLLLILHLKNWTCAALRSSSAPHIYGAPQHSVADMTSSALAVIWKRSVCCYFPWLGDTSLTFTNYGESTRPLTDSCSANM